MTTLLTPRAKTAVVLLTAGVLAALLFPGGATAHSTAANSRQSLAVPTVGRYAVYEITLPHSSAGVTNPWEDVTVAVTFRSPSLSFVVGGFYYGPDTWKARVAPDSVGRWQWSATINDPRGNQRMQGSFDVVDTRRAGFVKADPTSPYRFVTSDGRAFNPIGYEHSLSDDTGNGTPFDEIGFDGQDPSRCPSDPRCITVRNHDGSVRWSAWVTDLNTKTAAFGAGGAGFNLYRWSVDNASFNLFKRIDPAGNVYLEREGRWGDELVRTLRAHGIRVFMTLLGFSAPFADSGHAAGGHTGSTGLEAVKRYARYVVDRYGAYVDFWELMNEVSHVPDAYDTELATAIRQRDPYRHLISTSWEKPTLPAIEIVAPHWYDNENELDSDAITAAMIERLKQYRKPIIFGEQGNTRDNWDSRSAVRYRLRSWAALFAGGSLISWDFSGVKDPQPPFGALYIGPQERAYIRVLSNFAGQIGPGAASTPSTVSTGLRSYALSATGRTWVYVVNARDHIGSTVAGRLRISSPVGGTATFRSPSDGSILGTAVVQPGPNTLRLPAFTTDLAVTISS